MAPGTKRKVEATALASLTDAAPSPPSPIVAGSGGAGSEPRASTAAVAEDFLSEVGR